MALEKRALVDVQIPIGDAEGEVAERVGSDVDAAGRQTVALHRRESSIVPDDLGDRIRRRYVASSSTVVRDGQLWLGGHSRTLAQPTGYGGFPLVSASLSGRWAWGAEDLEAVSLCDRDQPCDVGVAFHGRWQHAFGGGLADFSLEPLELHRCEPD